MEEEILAAQEAEQLSSINDTEINAECAEMYEQAAKDIQELVTAVSKIISNHPILVDKNFSLYYQHGRLGYLDLDAFAKSVNIEEIMNKKENQIKD